MQVGRNLGSCHPPLFGTIDFWSRLHIIPGTSQALQHTIPLELVSPHTPNPLYLHHLILLALWLRAVTVESVTRRQDSRSLLQENFVVHVKYLPRAAAVVLLDFWRAVLVSDHMHRHGL